MSERSVSLSPLPEDGPPAVEIPVGKSLTYRFVVKHVEEEDDAMLVVGVQFVVDGRVALTQKFRRPLKLVATDAGLIRVAAWQVIGFPANDGKQTCILVGNISNSGICACPSCMCQRHNFGLWPERLKELYEQRHGEVAAATRKSMENNLRVGEFSVEELAKIFEKKNLDGGVRLTAKQWRRLMIECGSVVAFPLL